jgi:hypothetical protein
MIACGSGNGSVHLMEVSENMTTSGKNDKAILNAVSSPFVFHSDFRALVACNEPFVTSGVVVAGTRSELPSTLPLSSRFQMLDRESKRERILEGKLREIRIKIKKEQEEAAKAAQQAALAAEMKDETPVLKHSTSEGE